jgi:hypothetical protein
MSEEDIQKISTFDDRVVQSPSQYAIVKGANSINSMPFSAQTENGAQHQYNIQVPNQGVYMDRALLWTSTCYLQVTAYTQPGVNTTSIRLGRDVSLNSFPLHRLINVVNGTINNQNVSFNCDVLNEVLALVDDDRNKIVRTCPTSTEYFLDKADEAVTGMSTIGGAELITNRADRTNGAYPRVWFTLANGTIPTGVVPVQIGVTNVAVNPVDGSLVPVAPAVFWAPNTAITFYIKFTSTEKFLLSPLIFSEMCDRDTGIFGLNNVLLTLNMAQPSFNAQLGRTLALGSALLNTAPGSTNIIAYNTTAPQVFQGSVINVQFLDPNWEAPLPSRSMVPYMDYSRYLSRVTGTTLPAYSAVDPTAHTLIPTQTITLPFIPDILLLSVRPENYADGTQGSFTFPIDSISLQWANRSGLLSSHTPEQLYMMSQSNGLKQTYEEWIGLATSARYASNYGKVPLTGGMLVLRPGIDFVLEPGQAPGMVGNFVFQANIYVRNQLPTAWADPLRVCVLAVNSGFFATVYGSSTIMRGVLDPADVISKGAVSVTQSTLQRMIGGGWMDGAKRFFSNAASGKYNDQAKKAWELGKALHGAYKQTQGGMDVDGGARSGGGYGSMSAGGPMGGSKRVRLLGERAM